MEIIGNMHNLHLEIDLKYLVTFPKRTKLYLVVLSLFCPNQVIAKLTVQQGQHKKNNIKRWSDCSDRGRKKREDYGIHFSYWGTIFSSFLTPV